MRTRRSGVRGIHLLFLRPAPGGGLSYGATTCLAHTASRRPPPRAPDLTCGAELTRRLPRAAACLPRDMPCAGRAADARCRLLFPPHAFQISRPLPLPARLPDPAGRRARLLPAGCLAPRRRAAPRRATALFSPTSCWPDWKLLWRRISPLARPSSCRRAPAAAGMHPAARAGGLHRAAAAPAPIGRPPTFGGKPFAARPAAPRAGGAPPRQRVSSRAWHRCAGMDAE